MILKNGFYNLFYFIFVVENCVMSRIFFGLFLYFNHFFVAFLWKKVLKFYAIIKLKYL